MTPLVPCATCFCASSSRASSAAPPRTWTPLSDAGKGGAFLEVDDIAAGIGRGAGLGEPSVGGMEDEAEIELGPEQEETEAEADLAVNCVVAVGGSRDNAGWLSDT